MFKYMSACSFSDRPGDDLGNSSGLYMTCIGPFKCVLEGRGPGNCAMAMWQKHDEKIWAELNTPTSFRGIFEVYDSIDSLGRLDHDVIAGDC